MAKLSEVEIPYLQMGEQNPAPATPTTGLVRVYAKDDGKLYIKDDAGTESDLTGAGGGSGAMTLIDSTLLASAAASITFSSIPNTYTSLLLVGRVRTDRVGNLNDNVLVRVGNGSVDTGANYHWVQNVTTQSGSTSGNTGTSDSSWARTVGATSADADAGFFAPYELRIIDYADTSQIRHMRGHGGHIAALSAFTGRQYMCAGVWDNTIDEIDIITLAPLDGSNFAAGTQLSLYGLA